MKADLNLYLANFGVQRALVEIISYLNQTGKKPKDKTLEATLEKALDNYSDSGVAVKSKLTKKKK